MSNGRSHRGSLSFFSTVDNSLASFGKSRTVKVTAGIPLHLSYHGVLSKRIERTFCCFDEQETASQPKRKKRRYCKK